jgi:hypothetical protein
VPNRLNVEVRRVQKIKIFECGDWPFRWFGQSNAQASP